MEKNDKSAFRENWKPIAEKKATKIFVQILATENLNTYLSRINIKLDWKKSCLFYLYVWMESILGEAEYLHQLLVFSLIGLGFSSISLLQDHRQT